MRTITVIMFVLHTYMPGQERRIEQYPMKDAAACAKQVEEHTQFAINRLPDGARQDATCKVTKDPGTL